ncbi:50S ribosomal protein L6 [Buchnera aphidicola (Mollitrichosiphum nigrofasciatum)]|uniref:50S ribosomal protein L6 n=1 Tax=Buchnera aphidicola TaxID=9 RepID=UPI0031B8B2AE
MSRIAKFPVLVPSDVEVILSVKKIVIKHNNRTLKHYINKNVNIKYIDKYLTFNVKKNNSNSWAQAGTCRSLVASMILGLTVGFERKLQLVGVGYRVINIINNVISLSLGYSHIITYKFPNDIFIENTKPTEILIKGVDKQKVGQVAADLRSYRIPEVYKGKGIRYQDEFIRIKEAKKK